MPSNFYHYEIRKTKRSRRCSRCSKILRKKTEYYRAIWRQNGKFEYLVLCLSCGLQEIEKCKNRPIKHDYVVF